MLVSKQSYRGKFIVACCRRQFNQTRFSTLYTLTTSFPHQIFLEIERRILHTDKVESILGQCIMSCGERTQILFHKKRINGNMTTEHCNGKQLKNDMCRLNLSPQCNYHFIHAWWYIKDNTSKRVLLLLCFVYFQEKNMFRNQLKFCSHIKAKHFKFLWNLWSQLENKNHYLDVLFWNNVLFKKKISSKWNSCLPSVTAMKLNRNLHNRMIHWYLDQS